ncbi:MAG: glycosyltransferase family 2 protein [Elusimicrobiales bacterium]|nr:glycosyltransferase family 2 protein [Elusimicrobiales bacterium]
MEKPQLAIILPCYNEEAALPGTFAKITDLLSLYISKGLVSEKSRAYFINDGSSDGTWQLIKNKSADNHLVRGISLSRNFGHQNALLAGLHSIDADIYITIDADLQDNPESIEEMLEKHSAGAEIVCGVRLKRDKDTFFKKHTALLYYRIMNLCGVKIIPNHADFRLMGKKSVAALRQFNEKCLFLRGLVPYLGFKTDCVYYDRTERQAGETKYPLKKMIAFAWNGITGFTVLPLKLITFLGAAMFLSGFVVLLFSGNYSFFIKAFSMLCFFSGINLIALGLAAEYIGKILTEAKNRPSFIIEEKTKE